MRKRSTTKAKHQITDATTPIGTYTILIQDSKPKHIPKIKLLKWRRKNEFKNNKSRNNE